MELDEYPVLNYLTMCIVRLCSGCSDVQLFTKPPQQTLLCALDFRAEFSIDPLLRGLQSSVLNSMVNWKTDETCLNETTVL